MKGVGLLVGAIAAATSAAFSFSGDWVCTFYPEIRARDQEARISRDAERGTSKAPAKEIFAPRFDGLRFIETLITAHR